MSPTGSFDKPNFVRWLILDGFVRQSKRAYNTIKGMPLPLAYTIEPLQKSTFYVQHADDHPPLAQGASGHAPTSCLWQAGRTGHQCQRA